MLHLGLSAFYIYKTEWPIIQFLKNMKEVAEVSRKFFN